MASDQKRLFLTLSLSALVLFGWQYFFAPKNQFENGTLPKTESASTAVENQSNTTSKTVENRPVVDSTEANKISSVSNPAVTKAQSFTLKNSMSEVKINSNLLISSMFPLNEDRDEFTAIVGKRKPFQFFIVRDGVMTPLNFNFSQTDAASISGSDSRFGVSFHGNIDDKGLFVWNLKSTTPYQYLVRMESTEQEGEGRQVRQYITLLKDTKHTKIDSAESYDGPLQWMGIDYHYHLFANVIKGKPMASINIDSGNLVAKIIESRTKLSGFSFYGLKGYDELQKVGSNLHLAVDFGIFGIIAVPILKGLQFFYKFAPNYGVAIILITLFIRTLLFPLQFKSFKSMKKMQKLQPELAKLKEKHADDPQKMQRATMELFKKNGANPMGGCLPLLLQMPVFFAFYQVLFNSVELLHAPFVFWIHDLSAKDPYYMLPVLMGIAMFFQTKLNPSTSADPMQKKMMMFMPLIFTFFMKDLPAGLNLYIFVSTVFGVTQQLFVYKTVD